MKRYALTQAQVPLFLAGATELRVAVKPQPIRDAPDKDLWWWYREYRDPDSSWVAYDSETLRELIASELELPCPYPVGSLVALTETWGFTKPQPYCGIDLAFVRKADGKEMCGHWRSPATMPAGFSRFPRRVTAVRVEHGEQWTWVLTLEAK